MLQLPKIPNISALKEQRYVSQLVSYISYHELCSMGPHSGTQAYTVVIWNVPIVSDRGKEI